MTTTLCVDPATVGFDLTLDDYVAAVAAGGFRAAEWPVTWARPDPEGDCPSARAAFDAAGVTPVQFTSGLGVPGNLAVRAPEFARRLAEFAGHCRTGRAVGSARAAAFFDGDAHGGVDLSEQEILDRATAVAAVAAGHGVEVVIGWHGRRMLQLCGRVHHRAGGAFGVIVDTYTVARHGFGPEYVRSLPAGSVRWVRLGDAVRDEGFRRRLLPGTGTLDVAGIVRACRDNGYSGPLSVEVTDAPPGTDAPGRARRAYQAVEGIDL